MSKAALNSGSRSEMKSLKSSRPALSVLIVEDDPVARDMIGLVISKKFPDVIINIAENGKQGMELFNEQMTDIVITDINMPGMDGVQMACAIKSIKDDTRFIVLTGYSDKTHLDKFSEIGATDYIVKPIEFKKLFAAVEKCIAAIRLERR
jgi:YesN/AraC family two-component response regulator